MRRMKYAAYGIVLVLLASLTTPIYAQAGLTVSTDKTEYMTGDTVIVTGSVPSILEGLPITIQAINANGARFNLDQIFPNNDGTFSWEFRLSGSEVRLGPSGTWSIIVTYGELQGQTEFTFTAMTMPSGVKVVIDGEEYILDIKLTNGRITNVIAEPNIATLTLEVSMNDDGQLTATLPRTFLDSLTEGCSGDDDDFVILLDGQTEFPEETKDNGNRIITIDVPVETTEIAIVGTCMVPEFGVVAALVLAASVGAIIIASRRNIINLRY